MKTLSALSHCVASQTAVAKTPREEYTNPLTPENAAVLFIDNQTNLMLGVQSIDTVLLRNNTEGMAELAKLFDLPVVLTTTGGGANGPAGGLAPSITAFPDEEIIDRTDYFNAMSDPRVAAAVEATGRKKDDPRRNHDRLLPRLPGHDADRAGLSCLHHH